MDFKVQLVRDCNKCPACHANQRTYPSALAFTGNASDDGSETRVSDNLSGGLFPSAASCGFGETCTYSIGCVAYFSRDDLGTNKKTADENRNHCEEPLMDHGWFFGTVQSLQAPSRSASR